MMGLPLSLEGFGERLYPCWLYLKMQPEMMGRILCGLEMMMFSWHHLTWMLLSGEGRDLAPVKDLTGQKYTHLCLFQSTDLNKEVFLFFCSKDSSTALEVFPPGVLVRSDSDDRGEVWGSVGFRSGLWCRTLEFFKEILCAQKCCRAGAGFGTRSS